MENDCVKLSPLGIKHIEVLEPISNETNLWTYFIENGQGLNRLSDYIKATMDKRSKNEEYAFVIYDKIKNQYAGTTRFYSYNQTLKSIKLGHTWIGRNFRGTYLNKNCKYLLLSFAFEKLIVERVGFGVHSENKRSLMAMKSIGCTKEGVLRNFVPSAKTKNRADIVQFSILSHEWFLYTKKTLQLKLNHN